MAGTGPAMTWRARRFQNESRYQSRIALRAIRATNRDPTTWSLPAMRANDGSRTAAEVLVDQLVIHGARQVFCVPGESYIAALDAMVERPVDVTVCRQESGAC